MRRWFQFSLRSLLLLVLLVATYCAGWKSSQLKHERELQEAVRKAVEHATKSENSGDIDLSVTDDYGNKWIDATIERRTVAEKWREYLNTTPAAPTASPPTGPPLKR